MNGYLTRAGMTLIAMLALGLGEKTWAAEADSKSPVGPDKVLHHISDTEAQASRAMQYINNHLEVNPKAKIVVVTHAFGVDFLM